MIEENAGLEDDEKQRHEQIKRLTVAADSLQKHLWGVLIVSFVGPVLVIWYVNGANSLMSLKQAPELFDSIDLIYEEFEIAESGRRGEMAELRTLISMLHLDTSELKIKEMADLLYENEAQFQLFFRLLKVNAYSLGDHIFGVHSWFERYGGQLDEAIARSEARQLQLLRILEFYRDIANEPLTQPS